MSKLVGTCAVMWLLLLVPLAILDANAEQDKGDSAKDELKKMEGKWKVIKQESKGKDSTSERLTVVIEGDSYTAYRDGKTRISSYRLKLDPTKEPKTIDMTITFGSGKGFTAVGIYRFNKDGDLEISKADARAKGAGIRPKDFSTAGEVGSGRVLHVLKREAK